MQQRRRRRAGSGAGWDPVADWYAGWVGEHGSEYCVQPITTQPVPNPYYLISGELPEYLPTTVNPVHQTEPSSSGVVASW